MSEVNTIVKQNSFDIVRNEGDKLIQDNEFFKDLTEIMENETFAKFFKKYFYDSTESKITIIYMTLYQEFKTKLHFDQFVLLLENMIFQTSISDKTDF